MSGPLRINIFIHRPGASNPALELQIQSGASKGGKVWGRAGERGRVPKVCELGLGMASWVKKAAT